MYHIGRPACARAPARRGLWLWYFAVRRIVGVEGDMRQQGVVGVGGQPWKMSWKIAIHTARVAVPGLTHWAPTVRGPSAARAGSPTAQRPTGRAWEAPNAGPS